MLKRHGLRYATGGRILPLGSSLASESMADALKHRDFEPLDVEFRRALRGVEEDPGSAVTAACSLLEALLGAYLNAVSIPLPRKQTIKPLWSAASESLGLHPKDQTDDDIQRVLSGMTSVVDGIGAFRTHSGSAHGGGGLRYRVRARHAKLVVNSAQTLALFLIETWEEREKKRR